MEYAATLGTETVVARTAKVCARAFCRPPYGAVQPVLQSLNEVTDRYAARACRNCSLRTAAAARQSFHARLQR